MRKLFCLVIESVSLGLGLIGMALPILPTVPFVMFAMLCFAKASNRISEYFLSKPFIKKIVDRKLSRKERFKVMLILGFWFLVIGSIMGVHMMLVLGTVWVFHLVYFFIYFEKVKG